MKLKGKAVVVTGASRGIGRSIAEAFAAEGANIAICARNPAQVDETVAALTARGVKAWGAVVDVSDGPALQAFVTRAGETLGGIDVLVSNVSAMDMGADEAAWTDMFTLDILGAVRIFEAAKPFLERAGREHGDAAFLLLASMAAGEAMAPSAYGAMKAALIHYAKGLARQYAPSKVRCNVISPGNIYFPDGYWAGIEANHPGVYAAHMARNPTGRMGGPDEVADLAVFLGSPRSAYTTGANVVIDGAKSLRVG